MLNFDMSGQGTGDLALAGGDFLGKPWRDYTAGLTEDELSHLSFHREDGHGASDNWSFSLAGVPAIAFWSRGQHPFYHHYDDDPQWISESVLQKMGDRAEHFTRFLCNYSDQIAGRSDSLAILAHLAEKVDFKGFSMDTRGTVSEIQTSTAAWIPDDSYMTFPEMVNRMSELSFTCAQRKMSSDGLKQAIQSGRKQKQGVFVGASQTIIGARKQQEVASLLKQGLSVIRLASGDLKGQSLPQNLLDACRDGGAYALIPLDFAAKDRVEKWKKQSIVTGTLKSFAAMSEAVREGLLKSDAMVILDVTETPSTEELHTLQSGRARRLHLNFGTSREQFTKMTISALYAAGYTREGILMLSGGNLRRYFGA
jgi:hypothetical protein